MTDTEDATPIVTPAPLSDRRRWLALAVLCTAFFMGVLDSTSVYSALPSIAGDLDFSAAGVQWVITAYGVTVGGLLLLGGRVADLMGRRKVFMAAVTLFAAASLVCGAAWSGEVLIAGRAAQGIGAAFMTPAGLSILMTLFPDGPERNKALGIWGGLGGVGATAGLLLGGVLTDWLGWAWTFFINVPVCVAVLGASLVLLPESRRTGSRNFDLAGAVTITTALVLLLFSLFTIADVGWRASNAIGYVVIAIVLLVLFVAIERRSAAPLIPPRVLRSGALVAGNGVVFVSGIAVDGLLIVVTMYAQDVLGYSAVEFGLTMAVMTVLSVVGVLVGQHVVTRIGFGPVAVGGMVLIGVGCLLLTRISAAGGFDDLLLGLLVFGPGMGAAFVAAQIAALSGVAPQDSGLASGIEETSFAIGSTFGVALVSAFAVSRTERLLDAGADAMHARVEGFQFAIGMTAGVALLGVLAALTLLRRPSGVRRA
ncbi:MFS transporter [Phytoactinopolyspora alkaliphila]|uniref:MFS transporter n=1 Tax=Phytoactinopolyspora alkaliphila TaxID=1783498 RepID=A0A6N9YM09_9ACTN|nr:MFS transporter [Phytoactinopolyspora alkaliphila]